MSIPAKAPCFSGCGCESTAGREGAGPGEGEGARATRKRGLPGGGSPGTDLERRGVRSLESGEETKMKQLERELEAPFWLSQVSRGLFYFFLMFTRKLSISTSPPPNLIVTY